MAMHNNILVHDDERRNYNRFVEDERKRQESAKSSEYDYYDDVPASSGGFESANSDNYAVYASLIVGVITFIIAATFIFKLGVMSSGLLPGLIIIVIASGIAAFMTFSASICFFIVFFRLVASLYWLLIPAILGLSIYCVYSLVI